MDKINKYQQIKLNVKWVTGFCMDTETQLKLKSHDSIKIATI